MKSLLLVFSIIFSFPSYSALISVDLDSAGDELLTYDTRTDLEWLDLSLTGRNSVNNMLNGVNGRDFFSEGFTLATYDQIIDIFTSVGISEFGFTRPNIVNDAGADLLASFGLFPEDGMREINGMGIFVFGQSGGSASTSRYISMDNRNTLSASVLPGYYYELSGGKIVAGSQLAIRNSTVYPSQIGHVLVRQTTTVHVHEPSIFALMSLGIIGFAFSRGTKR
jgi:hypothetical protein|tara:strand:+ start:2571 stop:3239 length:669 start_codon:yes stop_codon:yes gene_type:complete